jgi:hypothetical protein
LIINSFVSFTGDGYFEKPFNKIHPALSKIKTLSVEDIIERTIKV